MDLKKHRVLILGWPVKPAQKWLKNYHFVDVARIYIENVSKLQKKQKDLSFHMPKCLQFCDAVKPSTWYGDWKYNVEKYDTIILIDEVRGSDIFEYILERNPKCNLCVFFDSPIAKGSTREPSRYKHLPVRFFTCDRKIAKDYSIEFMPYFYIFSPYDFSEYKKLSSEEIKQDVFFIGEEKGDRRERIEKISAVLDKAKLKYDLRLVPQNRHSKLFGGAKNKLVKQAYMSYNEVIEYVKESKAVLELISAGQTGLTQRPYEALFLKKKLITTSAEIKNYDFYCEDNVFILGERSVDKLPEFLNSPLREIEDEIVKEYTLVSWIKRFLR